ncbi:MAG TPA: YggT family protein [Bacillota bacterium]|nr:YggT family protein [Bacillota bacterium]
MDRYINIFWELIVLVILLRIVLAWRRNRFDDTLGRWVYTVTEPLLRVFRAVIDTSRFGFDVAPVTTLVFFWLLKSLLIFLF